MKEHNMIARISQLHKTEAEWMLLPKFTPSQGEFIIFDPDERYEYHRLKIGDGYTPLIKLPFFIDNSVDNFITNNFSKIIDGGRITDYKK